MRVWLITVGEPLPTEQQQKRPWRTGLVARELIQRGHEVVWWTSTVNHFDKTRHETDNIAVKVSDRFTVRFLNGRLYRKNISLARFINHMQIGRVFARLARRETPPDLILCSLPTLELSEEAVRYGREVGIPVLLDIRDLWPDEFVATLPKQLQPMGKLLFAPMFASARRAIAGATGIIAVSETYLKWAYALAQRRSGPWDHVFTHGYPSASHTGSPGDGDAERLVTLGIDPQKKGFWFIGTFVGSIDLSTVISAARILAHRSDIEFIISGSGEDEDKYRLEASELSNVVFTGWIDQGDIGAISRHAYAGLGAYKKDALMSLTNKMFEYLSSGIPVLLALPGEATQIIVGNDCGRAYEPGNAMVLAQEVSCLADDSATQARMSINARALFETRFSADHIYSAMADFLERAAKTEELK